MVIIRYSVFRPQNLRKQQDIDEDANSIQGKDSEESIRFETVIISGQYLLCQI